MRGWWIAALGASACGDNTFATGEPISHADTVFFAAHTDDDMIFMQPEIVDAARTGSVATVYFTVGDAVKGPGLARGLLHASKTAYASIAGGVGWDCGYVELAVPVQHCKMIGRDISLIAVDLPDGGIPGDRTESLLHLVDGSVTSVDLVSLAGGTATRETTEQLAADLLAALSPAQIHALELAGTHGRDHSSHMFASAFLLWAAAHSGYAGPWTWHRGYNVANEQVTLDATAYDQAVGMLGYYEACAGGCAPCGVSCLPDALNPAHVTWIQRQYAVDRVPSAAGKLAFGDRCLQSSLVLGDCATAATFRLVEDGSLKLGDDCVTALQDDSVTVTTCDLGASQYWVLDSEGSLWSGLPPRVAGDMSYDHVRCLSVAGDGVSAGTCGSLATFAWRFTE